MKTKVSILPTNMHMNGPGHPESPKRLSTLEALFHKLAREGRIQLSDTAGDTPEDGLDCVFRIYQETHSREYITSLLFREVPTGTVVRLDPDTGFSEGSRKAIIACAKAVETLLQHRKTAGGIHFLAQRPPGHHALRDRSMGFCLVNHAGALVRNILQMDLDARLAVLDFDVHNGNGTEATLRDLNRCLFISTHQYPFYPGTGSGKDNRIDSDGGGILDLPLPEGTDDDDYRHVLREKILPRLEAFRPTDMILSAGFDGHRDDPLGGWLLTEEIFMEIGQSLPPLGCRFIASVLEGGYNSRALSRSVEAYLTGIG